MIRAVVNVGVTHDMTRRSLRWKASVLRARPVGDLEVGRVETATVSCREIPNASSDGTPLRVKLLIRHILRVA